MIFREARYKGLKTHNTIEEGDILQRKTDGLFYTYSKSSTVDQEGVHYSFFFGFIVKRVLLHLHFHSGENGSLLVFQEGVF